MSTSRFHTAVLIIVLATLVFAAVLVEDASARSFDPTTTVDMLCGGSNSGLALFTGAPATAALSVHAPTALRHMIVPRPWAAVVDARTPRFRGLRQASPSVTATPLRL
jgi:hypothetical protein